MQRITWYRLLAVGVLAAPIGSRAQAPKAPVVKANVRELATIEGEVGNFVRLPNGHVLLYSVDNSTFAYDIITKRRTMLGTDMSPRSVSPQGDRFAFTRSSEDHKGNFLWTMPIDPKTGTATGQAQRVSLKGDGFGRGLAPRFSPDGKTLAYTAGPLPDGTFNVTLVPVTGGPERVVANYPWRVWSGWSGDGKSLYVAVAGVGEVGGDPKTTVVRVPVAGGRTDPLFPLTALTERWVVGLSPDARVAFFQKNPDRFSYRTASGVEGEIEVSLPPLYDDGWGLDFSLDSSMRYGTMTQSFNQGVHVLDLATGQVRDLLPPNVQSSAPAWSPDGRRLAVRTGNASHYDITVMNADGSGQRRYPLSPEMSGRSMFFRAVGMLWSPDGRLLAFEADRGKLALLDVSSGQTRALATTLAGIGDFVWRSDGKAIRAIKYAVVPKGPRTMSIVEIDLDGTERPLRDISAEFPWARDAVMVSDRVALPGGDPSPRIVNVPIEGGAARQISIPIANSGAHLAYSGHSGDGKWALAKIITKSPETDILIISTTGDSTRIVHLPVESKNKGVAMHPDGQHIIVVGRKPGETALTIFVVPIDGGAPREFGGIPGQLSQYYGGTLSPDAKLLAFTTDGRHTSTIHEIDFRPALQAIVKKP